MNRPAGLVVMAALFCIAGLQALSRGSDAVAPVRAVQLVIGIVSLVVAYRVWTGHAGTMRAYWLWVAACLLGGGAVQWITERVSLVEITLWWVLTGIVWGLVGLYLKGALERMGPQRPIPAAGQRP